jgi:hypothetical protein
VWSLSFLAMKKFDRVSILILSINRREGNVFFNFIGVWDLSESLAFDNG